MTITQSMRLVDSLTTDLGLSTNSLTNLRYILLSIPTGLNLKFNDPISQFLQYEVKEPGYARAALDASLTTGPPIQTDTIANAVYREWQAQFTLSAGQSFTWNAEAFMYGGSNKSTANAAVTANTNAIVANAHGLAANEKITLSGTIPTSNPSIEAGELLYVNVLDANTFEVKKSPAGAGAIFSQAGSFTLHYANGFIHTLGYHSSTQAMAASRSIVARLGLK